MEYEEAKGGWGHIIMVLMCVCTREKRRKYDHKNIIKMSNILLN